MVPLPIDLGRGRRYCGCLYSLRDSNLWRKKEGIPAVKIGGETAGALQQNTLLLQGEYELKTLFAQSEYAENHAERNGGRCR